MSAVRDRPGPAAAEQEVEEAASVPTTIDGTRAEVLVSRFGSPLYVYDLDVIDGQVAALRSALPDPFEIAYAVKANPALGIVGHLARLGLGADIASGGELQTALRAGMSADRVVFTGPGKRDDELRAAAAAGLRAVAVESLGELDLLEAASAEIATRTPVLLRSAVAASQADEPVRILGDDGAGKFGMDRGDLARAAVFAVASPHLDLLGIHAFGASNVLDADAIVGHAERAMALGRALAASIGFPLRLIDIGGGLGIPYADHDRALDVRALGARMAIPADRWKHDPITREARVLMEPGRFLVGPAGTYIVRVVARKTINGHAVAVVDGGIHHLLRPALVQQAHRVTRLTGAHGDTPAGTHREAGGWAIAGPLCSGLDILARNVALGGLEVDDLLAVHDVGGYGYTESMPLFLSHPVPAEVAISGSRTALLRPRIEPREWLETQRDPGW